MEQFCSVCKTVRKFQVRDGLLICTRCLQSTKNDNFDYDQTDVAVNYNVRRSHGKRLRDKVPKSAVNYKPWKLEHLLEFIYDKQVESLKYLLNDPEHFEIISKKIWMRYMKSVGANFDILNAPLDEIKMTQNPLGFGSYYNPQDRVNKMTEATIVYGKRKRALFDENTQLDKRETGYKRIKLQRAIALKIKDQEIERNAPVLMNEDNEEIPPIINESQDDVMFSDDESDKASAFSDEEDENFIEIDNLKDRPKEISRILKNRSMGSLIFRGTSRVNNVTLLETNLVMLFISLSYVKLKPDHDLITLVDIIKLVKNYKIPYLKILSILPEIHEKFVIRDHSYMLYISRFQPPKYDTLYKVASTIYLTMNLECFSKFDKFSYIKRLIYELNLPRDLIIIVQLLYTKAKKLQATEKEFYRSKPIGYCHNLSKGVRCTRYSNWLLIENNCAALIFIALRLIYQLDDKYEFLLSEASHLHNETSSCPDKTLFVFAQWLSQHRNSLNIYKGDFLDDLTYYNVPLEKFLENAPIKSLTDVMEVESKSDTIFNQFGRLVSGKNSRSNIKLLYEHILAVDNLIDLRKQSQSCSSDNNSSSGKRDFTETTVSCLWNVKTCRDTIINPKSELFTFLNDNSDHLLWNKMPLDTHHGMIVDYESDYIPLSRSCQQLMDIIGQHLFMNTDMLHDSILVLEQDIFKDVLV